MSRTRQLIADLRRRLGADDPMPPRDAAPAIPPPPRRIHPIERIESSLASRAAAHTTALVGIGHVGSRYATDVVLQFQAELAVAHEAVRAELPDDFAEQNNLLPLRSRVTEHREFLLRPDLGRRLSPESAELLAQRATRGVDVQLILADGLSAVATMGSGMDMMREMTAQCERRGWSVGTPCCAKFARVWLEDEIGQITDAKVAVIILGERPGLGTGDGLSAYLVYGPKIGNTDGERNMMSNIHRRGTEPKEAAARLALLIDAMLSQRTSGVDLDISGLGVAAATGYREPQVRKRLVNPEQGGQ